MFKKFTTIIKKYWIVSFIVLFALPLTAFSAYTIYREYSYRINSAATGIVSLEILGNQVNLDPSKAGGKDYFVPAKTNTEFLSFLNSAIGKLISGSCSADCTGKSCGQLNGCGHKCIVQSCGANYTCSAAGVCVSTCQSDCGTKNCGMDSCGNSCGTCDAQSYCNGFAQCATATCGPSNCGFNQVGQSCGVCNGSDICISKWYPALNEYFYNCISCKPKCDGYICGNADGCGGYCSYCKTEGEACDYDKGGCVPCEKKCDGKVCGDDGCGGTCGMCGGGEACIGGNCNFCVPNSCDGLICGDDGCGGTCSCDKDAICGVDKKCYTCDRVQNCKGKVDCDDDGCGGTCGDKVCENGTVCRGENGCQPCSCEKQMCGDNGCGESCGECHREEICINGKCEHCPDGGMECGYEECGRYYGPCTVDKVCINNKCQ